MNVREALREIGAAARGMRIVRRLHVAPVKCSYLVARASERFVLRIDQPLARTLALDRRVEARVLRAAARGGVGPEVIAMRAHAPAILLTRYVPGRAWLRADLDDPRRIEHLAALLRRVHTLDPAGIPRLDLAQAAAHYARLGHTGGAASGAMQSGLKPLPPSESMRAEHTVGAASAAIRKSGLKSLRQEPVHPGSVVCGSGFSREAVAQVRSLLARAHDPSAAAVLCHNDPIAANVIGFRRPQFIDWEYAAAGEPLFDLAVVIEHHRLPARSARRFVAAYCGGASAVPEDRLDSYRAVYRRIRALWEAAIRHGG